jgi:hypothetical protein
LGPIFECACGLRYMRGVIDLDVAETVRAFCPCLRLLGEWRGKQRLVFDPEDELQPPTFR